MTLLETYPVSSHALEDHPTVARFIIGGVTPKLTEAIILAERVHAALVDLSDGSSLFTGCDGSGIPLKGRSHAFILCESNRTAGRGQNGEVTHIIIYALAGFGQRERLALENLWEIRGSGLQVSLILQGLGQPEDFGGTNVVRGESPLLAESRTWVSRTPFVPARHPKVTRAGVPKRDDSGLQIGSPEHEVRRLLRLDGFPEPLTVKPASYTELAGHRIGWSRFHKTRIFGNGRKAGSAGYGFRIEFAGAVRGPVALGYANHFGMGEFVPEPNRNQIEKGETELQVADEQPG